MIIFIGKDNLYTLIKLAIYHVWKVEGLGVPIWHLLKRQGLFCVFKKLISLQSV